MKRQFLKVLRSILVEFVIYGSLVAAYYLLVLHYLGHWLYSLYQDDRRSYAAVALGLIIGQGILLNGLTRLLLAWLRPLTEES
jgi:hypothetical protein